MTMQINPVPQSTEDLHWYCIRVEPNRESVAYRHLAAWIQELYMPVCERATVLDITKDALDENGQHKRVTVSTQRVSGPILRGYLFARLSMSDAAAVEIGETNGVLHLYPNNRKPYAIPDASFNRMRDACELLASAKETEEDFSWMIDKFLRIQEGTYQGFQGKCTDVIKGHAIIDLEMFKKTIPVPIPCGFIDPNPVGVVPQEHVVKSTRFGYKAKQHIAR